MPANLSPEYYEAEQSYRRATTDHERLGALQAMLSAIPKHKGTEKMQADIKSRIAKFKQEIKRSGGKAKRHDPSHVKREGAGQVVLVGSPNSGKSALVAAVTNARPEVATYPFTTQSPQPAMMPFENVQIQLVDTPAVSREYTPGWLANLVRYADVACLVADTGNDACLENVEAVLAVLEEKNVRLVSVRSNEVSVLSRVAEVPTVLVANKVDRSGAEERTEILREFFGGRFEIITVSTIDDTNLGFLRQRLFECLNVIRVCTKARGKEAETDRPFVLPSGSTVADLARNIHKDLAQTMQFARIWGAGRYAGQRVPRDHELADMDIVEIHG